MKLTYTITAEQHQEAIAFQLRMKQNSPYSALRYWLGNWGIFLASVGFSLLRSGFPLAVRLIPVVISGVLLVVTSVIRFSVDRQAAVQQRKSVESGAVNEGFLGTHILSVRKDTVLVEYGRHSQKIFCRQVEELRRGEKVSYLMAGGDIFELIPNEILDRDDCGEKLMETIRNNVVQMQQEQSEARRAAIEAEQPSTFCSCPVDKERTARSMAAGYRMYYRTNGAWKGQQTLRAVVLIYGLVMVIAGPNRGLGAAVAAVGLLLNRRLLTVLSPMVLSSVRRVLDKRGSELADDFFYTTDREIVAVSYGQEVRCNKVDVAEMRENKEFLAFYTKDQRMVVIHKAACNTPETLARFKNRM